MRREGGKINLIKINCKLISTNSNINTIKKQMQLFPYHLVETSP